MHDKGLDMYRKYPWESSEEWNELSPGDKAKYQLLIMAVSVDLAYALKENLPNECEELNRMEIDLLTTIDMMKVLHPEYERPKYERLRDGVREQVFHALNRRGFLDLEIQKPVYKLTPSMLDEWFPDDMLKQAEFVAFYVGGIAKLSRTKTPDGKMLAPEEFPTPEKFKKMWMSSSLLYNLRYSETYRKKHLKNEK